MNKANDKMKAFFDWPKLFEKQHTKTMSQFQAAVRQLLYFMDFPDACQKSQ